MEPPCSVGPATAYLAVTYLDRFLTKRVTQVDEEQYTLRLASFMFPRTDPSLALFLFQVKQPWFAVFLSLACLSLASKMLDHGFSVAEFQVPFRPCSRCPSTLIFLTSPTDGSGDAAVPIHAADDRAVAVPGS